MSVQTHVKNTKIEQALIMYPWQLHHYYALAAGKQRLATLGQKVVYPM